ncbi:hypothetical protein DFP72DRAFT_891700 [Ephemerocybe angulata]|uniref:NAD-dependent epimerase/dehydratase domain-containing protein n=1 Tax=Ephemerocybe angulata TaxID=980116 RepID=A0A8H6I365_9AGAR|nr:hypothetical protein DFP72DRAFT_891700 [Tulosesus angulatus]
MKIAVTGCNGRVGRPTVKLALLQGHEVVGIDTSTPPEDCASQSEKYTFYTADLTNFDTTLEVLKGCDAVIHLAGAPGPGDYKVDTHNNNVVLSWNIIRACAELGINRIAQASSVNILTMVYSATFTIQYLPVDEAHPCVPDEPYGLSKLIAETQASSIVRRYPKMRIASLRLSWTVPERKTSADRDPYDFWTARDFWGYTQQDSAADAFIRAVSIEGPLAKANGVNGKELANGKGVALNGFGEGRPSKDWTSGHEAFFITAPEIAQNLDSKTLKDRFWPDIPLKAGASLEGQSGFFDCSKAREYLGWVHKEADEWAAIKEGLAKKA